MGGHWGTSSSARSGSTVRASQVADALEAWTYSASPTDRDAIAGRLSAAFPSATVRRGDGSTAYDAVVDDIGVVIAHRLDAAFRRDVYALAERFDDVVVYSTTPHTETPDAWREFRHRHRGSTAGARIRFVHRDDSSASSGPSPARALATIAIATLAIGGLLAASMGVFVAGEVAPAGVAGAPVVTVASLLLGAAVAIALARRRVSIAVLKRIPHT